MQLQKNELSNVWATISERWCTLLSLGRVKGPESQDEYYLLVRRYGEHPRQWSLIAKQLPGGAELLICEQIDSNQKPSLAKEIAAMLIEFIFCVIMSVDRSVHEGSRERMQKPHKDAAAQ
jgi:hypothetical protein